VTECDLILMGWELWHIKHCPAFSHEFLIYGAAINPRWELIPVKVNRPK
jgi:hypothetical protein